MISDERISEDWKNLPLKAMKHAYGSYEEKAFGFDEIQPMYSFNNLLNL